MTFDLDLCLQGHSTLFWLGIQHDSIVWVIMRRRGYPQNEGVLIVLVSSDNGLSSNKHQAIIWSNSDTSLFWPRGWNWMKFFIENKTFSFENNVFKMLSAKQRPFCIGRNVSSVMLAKLSSTKQFSDCWRTGHSLNELLTESLTHVLTDWLTNWLIDCLIDWLAHSCLGSMKNKEDCYARLTPRNKYSLLFLICSVTMS